MPVKQEPSNYKHEMEESKPVALLHQLWSRNAAEVADALRQVETILACDELQASVPVCVVHALTEHVGDLGVVLEAFEVIVQLMEEYDDVAATLGASGAVSTILDAVQRHHGSLDGLAQGIGVLTSLVYQNKANAKAFVQCKGLPWLIKKMGLHAKDEEVQRWACQLLENLLDADPTSVAAIQRAGALVPLAKAVAEHGADEQIKGAGCAVLMGLSSHIADSV